MILAKYGVKNMIQKYALTAQFAACQKKYGNE
jgi:DNA polymerase III delta prime subunit